MVDFTKLMGGCKKALGFSPLAHNPWNWLPEWRQFKKTSASVFKSLHNMTKTKTKEIDFKLKHSLRKLHIWIPRHNGLLGTLGEHGKNETVDNIWIMCPIYETKI